jgi:putative tricarboxylic transport membrane protein
MISRRHVIRNGLLCSVFAASGLPAFAAPTSLQIFVPAAPGGGWDQTARSIEAAMRKDNIITSFRVEHRPGAGGAVGLPVFVSTKKGNPEAIMIGGLVMVGSLVANNSPVGLNQVTPLARLTGEAEIIVVPAQSPFKTMQDLVAAMKADVGKVSFAGGSAGGTDHILAGMMAKALGLDPRKVAYVAYAGGGPAQAALLGNQVSAGISGVGEFAEQVKAGKLRALAVSSASRLADFKDVPTLRESGVDVELSNWRGVFGAPGITDAQRKDLIGLIEKMVNGPAWKSELETKGWDGLLLTGDGFKKYVDEESIRITAILTDLGLKK